MSRFDRDPRVIIAAIAFASAAILTAAYALYTYILEPLYRVGKGVVWP